MKNRLLKFTRLTFTRLKFTLRRGWLRGSTMVMVLLTGAMAYGQAVPGAKPAGILPANGFGPIAGQAQAGPGFGQGVQVQIPQVAVPGQLPPNSGFSGGYRQRRGFGSGGSGFGGGSTPYGSAMAGQAAALQGQGAFELGTAQGNVLNQQATGMYFDTYKQAVNSYFDVKRIHDTAKAEHEKPPASREQLEAAAKVGVPQRLTKDEFESATGKIAWPEILSKDVFAQDRTKLELLFGDRMKSGGGQGTDNFRAIRVATSQMQNRLQGMASSLTPQEYVVGHKFIASLAHEGGMIPRPGAAPPK